MEMDSDGKPECEAARPDAVTEALVMAFIEMIQEHKVRGYHALEATWVIVSKWLSNRTGLAVQPRHVGSLVDALAQAGIVTIGGGGIGAANTYDTTERAMGTQQFWTQIDAFLLAWCHPSRKSMTDAVKQSTTCG